MHAQCRSVFRLTVAAAYSGLAVLLLCILQISMPSTMCNDVSISRCTNTNKYTSIHCVHLNLTDLPNYCTLCDVYIAVHGFKAGQFSIVASAGLTLLPADLPAQGAVVNGTAQYYALRAPPDSQGTIEVNMQFVSIYLLRASVAMW
jgi:hypothetical protein